jgi:ectoine hydroxylase-related dioxygenase (phytanoyl-CoA dioxygenase family)
MSQYPLTDEQIEHYRTEGYLVVPRVFGEEDLAKIDRTIAEMTAQALANPGEMSKVLELEPEPIDGRRVPRRIYNPYDAHETFRTLATDPRVLDRIESLIGFDINLQHSKLNMKPAKVGSVVEWHQDLAYFPHTNDDLVTTLIYLDDATEENGCLQVMPRHHSHYFRHATAEGYFAGMITEDITDGRFGRPLSLPAPAGSVIFMHCITPHSSLPNRSTRSRRTLIFEYRAADAFPIYFGEGTHASEQKLRPIRGKVAKFARFGGPPPSIPHFPPKFQSLYQLQEDSKTKSAKPVPSLVVK